MTASKVWYAQRTDLPRVVDLAREEHALSAWRDVAFDPRLAEDTLLSFLMLPRRVLLVSRSGYLAGLLQPLGFSAELIALEYAWFAKDGAGVTLLREFTAWARRLRAVGVVAHNYTDDPRFGWVMPRFGFQPLGSAFMRPLTY